MKSLLRILIFLSACPAGIYVSGQEGSGAASIPAQGSVFTIPEICWNAPNPFSPDYLLSEISRELHQGDIAMLMRRHRQVPAWNGISLNYRPETSVVMWNGGAAGAYGSVGHYPGLMGIETGGIFLRQNVGKVSFETHAFAEKYGYFNGLTTNYGVGGNIEWRIDDKLSLHAFGTYMRNNVMLPTPALQGFAGTSYYGGFLRWDTSSHWGIDVGAQNVYNTSLRSWEVKPIVRPYYKFSNGKTIGIDVGSILYGILQATNVITNQGPRNPTIGPPVR